MGALGTGHSLVRDIVSEVVNDLKAGGERTPSAQAVAARIATSVDGTALRQVILTVLPSYIRVMLGRSQRTTAKPPPLPVTSTRGEPRPSARTSAIRAMKGRS
jgi:hypothetical protein